MLIKMSEYAPGLPDPKEYGDLSRLEGLKRRLTNFAIQRHLAEQAGEHYDLRIGGPEGLYSWALPKAKIPGPGGKRLAIRQPLHSPGYAGFEGEIPEGYGKGSVELARSGKVMPTKIKKDKDGGVYELNFSLVSGTNPERFKLKKMNRTGEWLLINTTPTEAPEHKKLHYKTLDQDDKEQLEEMISRVSEDRPASVKIDGALGLLKFMGNRAEVMSYRTSRRTGGPILHTERIAPQFLSETPEELEGKTFEGEIYARSPEGRTLKPQEISGLLNSAVAKSREKQKREGISFRMALFDVLPRDLDEEQKQKLITRAVAEYPELLTRPPRATSPEEAGELLGEVQSGEHPLSGEGMVFRTGGRPVKFKPRMETDVVIQKIFPGRGKYEGEAAGGFEYSLTPEGPIVGKVGTGLSDETRRDMHEDPEKYLGRAARISAQQQFESGAYRAPAFSSLHEDYPREAGGTIEWGKDIGSRL